ncbi:MAG: hypothetical protein HFH75_04450 [Lachnospiraceae bacterium]|jgi:DNA-binding LytR/AlgR family response regulator|nr:hypothetical protein [Lachnospiraceae bacterium]
MIWKAENVMRVIICDDIQKDKKTTRAALDTYSTVHPEYCFEIDEYSAALDLLHMVEKGNDYLSLDCLDGIYQVRISEIASTESQNHYLRINLSSGKVLRLRMKRSQMFEEVQKYPDFIRGRVSYIVNFDFARSIFGNSIEIQCGAKIPVSRRSVGEVQRAYMEFCRKETGK